MKTIIVICDDYPQFRKYVINHPERKTMFIPLFENDVRKIMALERTGIEIRMIGDKAIFAFVGLRVDIAPFGISP